MSSLWRTEIGSRVVMSQRRGRPEHRGRGRSSPAPDNDPCRAGPRPGRQRQGASSVPRLDRLIVGLFSIEGGRLSHRCYASRRAGGGHITIRVAPSSCVRVPAARERPLHGRFSRLVALPGGLRTGANFPPLQVECSVMRSERPLRSNSDSVSGRFLVNSIETSGCSLSRKLSIPVTVET